MYLPLVTAPRFPQFSYTPRHPHLGRLVPGCLIQALSPQLILTLLGYVCFDLVSAGPGPSGLSIYDTPLAPAPSSSSTGLWDVAVPSSDEGL